MAFPNGSPRHVQVDRGAVRNLESDIARLERAAVARLRATDANFDRSAVAFASFDHGTLRQSAAGVVIARSLACDEVRTGVLISPVVRGEVHTWFDMRSAVALGVGFALGQAFLKGTKSLVRRR
jgi:hypothetical protein